ncbi:MAG: riboflavin biosynthesis protein RibD [Pseudomonadota bacterium]|jgi:diaminohydroxyphosphoribosylaminopyrimidine deaminase/5-amino-6-(5-phosphoribosylamino)uracil reductase
MISGDEDERHMRHALRLARRSLGRVAPNPAVGCVILSKDGVVAGRGWTAPGGRPHAETIALQQAGTKAEGGTAYVTLEPCAHYGVTPPCATALIAAGIARVVGAAADPDPRVNGKGYSMLRDAGILVLEHICEAEARALNAGFFSRIEKGRPLIALKGAESADGFVAGTGSERWITSDLARRHGHLLRAKFDAILVGIETVLADDPLLTCRLEGLTDRTPVRIVLDSHLRLPPQSQLARSATQSPVLVFTLVEKGGDALTEAGVHIFRVAADKDGHADIGAVLALLVGRGITRLLVEGGPTVHQAFISAGLVDWVYRYRAPHELGRGVASVLTPLLASAGAAGAKVEAPETIAFGPDLLESYKVKV